MRVDIGNGCVLTDEFEFEGVGAGTVVLVDMAENLAYCVEDLSQEGLDEIGDFVMWGVIGLEYGVREGEVVDAFNRWANGRAEIVLEEGDVSYYGGVVVVG